MKVWVMILDLLVSALLSIITLTEGNFQGKNESSLYLNESNGTNSTATAHAVSSVVIFVMSGLAYIVIIVYYCYKIRRVLPGQHNWVARVFLTRHNLVALGGLCYYFGDNLPPLIEYYRNELNCKPECVEVIQLIGAFTLGFAAITYLPLQIDVVPNHNVQVRNDDEYAALTNNTNGECTCSNKKALVCAAVIMLAKTTNFDLVYTAIERAVSFSCNIQVMIVAWMYWLFYTGFFLIVSLYEVCSYENAESTSAQSGNTTNADNRGRTGNARSTVKEYIKRKCTSTCTLGTFYAILLSVFAGLYILADNRLPLACSGVAKDDINVRGLIRLSMWVVAVFVAGGVIVVWSWWQSVHDQRYVLY